MLSVFIPIIPHLQVHLVVLTIFTLAYTWLDAAGHFAHVDPRTPVTPIFLGISTHTLLGAQDPRPRTAVAQGTMALHTLVAWGLTITMLGTYLKM